MAKCNRCRRRVENPNEVECVGTFCEKRIVLCDKCRIKAQECSVCRAAGGPGAASSDEEERARDSNSKRLKSSEASASDSAAEARAAHASGAGSLGTAAVAGTCPLSQSFEAAPAATTTTTTAAETEPPYPELLILHVDVGQGECTLIVEWEPDQPGSPMARMKPLWVGVIDGGYATAGRGPLSRYLDQLGIDTIHDMFCTHFDGDHTKGLTATLHYHVLNGDLRVENLWVRNDDEGDYKSNTKLELLQVARQIRSKEEGRVGHPLTVQCAAVQDEVPLRGSPSGNLRLECIHAMNAGCQDENDGSLAYILNYKDFRYYTAGDLPSIGEESLLEGDGPHRVDAFKCGHHGSANSTSEDFLKARQPTLAFISCGSQSFGHPTYDVVERLCSDDSTVEGLFLTNCIHNRKVLNIRYDEQEVEIRNKIQAMLDEETEGLRVYPIYQSEAEAAGSAAAAAAYATTATTTTTTTTTTAMATEVAPPVAATVYNRDLINDSLTRAEAAGAERSIKSYLRAAQRAAQHELWQIGKHVPSFVGGNAVYPGTIALRVSSLNANRYMAVGFMHCPRVDAGGEWRWETFPRGARNESEPTEELNLRADILQGRILPAVIASGRDYPFIFRGFSPLDDGAAAAAAATVVATDTQPASPAAAAASRLTAEGREGTPGVYEAHFTSRKDEYRRFTAPTIVGLRERRVVEFVPFCLVCNGDTPIKEGGVDYEILDIECPEHGIEDDVCVHLCCYMDWLRRVPRPKVLKRDVEAVVKGYLAYEGRCIKPNHILHCPHCNHDGKVRR